MNLLCAIVDRPFIAYFRRHYSSVSCIFDRPPEMIIFKILMVKSLWNYHHFKFVYKTKQIKIHCICSRQQADWTGYLIESQSSNKHEPLNKFAHSHIRYSTKLQPQNVLKWIVSFGIDKQIACVLERRKPKQHQIRSTARKGSRNTYKCRQKKLNANKKVLIRWFII